MTCVLAPPASNNAQTISGVWCAPVIPATVTTASATESGRSHTVWVRPVKLAWSGDSYYKTKLGKKLYSAAINCSTLDLIHFLYHIVSYSHTCGILTRSDMWMLQLCLVHYVSITSAQHCCPLKTTNFQSNYFLWVYLSLEIKKFVSS